MGTHMDQESVISVYSCILAWCTLYILVYWHGILCIFLYTGMVYSVLLCNSWLLFALFKI